MIPICVAWTWELINPRIWVQYAPVSNRRRAHPTLIGRTSFLLSSLYSAINCDSATSSPNTVAKSPLPHRVATCPAMMAHVSVVSLINAHFNNQGLICCYPLEVSRLLFSIQYLFSLYNQRWKVCLITSR